MQTCVIVKKLEVFSKHHRNAAKMNKVSRQGWRLSWLSPVLWVMFMRTRDEITPGVNGAMGAWQIF
jgi:hypothetical protein